MASHSPGPVAICKGLMINQNTWELSYLLFQVVYFEWRYVLIYLYEFIYIYIYTWTCIRHVLYRLECIRVFKFKYIQVCIFMICANADMYVYLTFVLWKFLQDFTCFHLKRRVYLKDCAYSWGWCEKEMHVSHIWIYIYIYVYIYIHLRLNIDVIINLSIYIYTYLYF